MPSLIERMRRSQVSSPYEALGIGEPRYGLDPEILAMMRDRFNIEKQQADIANQSAMQDIALRGQEFTRRRGLERIGSKPGVVYQPPLAEMQRPQLEAVKMAERELNTKARLGGEEIASRERIAGLEGSIEQQKIAVEAWKAQNPNGEIKLGKDGFYHLVNPKTGEITRTSLKSGDLTKEKEIELQQKGQIELERERQKGRTELEGARQTNRVELEKFKSQYEKGELPTQTRTRVFNNAQQFLAQNPQHKNNIVALPDGTVQVKPTGDPVEDTRILNAIFGNIKQKDVELKSEVGKLTDAQKAALNSLTPSGKLPAGTPGGTPAGVVPKR